MDSRMTITNWHIAVLVPARDEEELLPRCLRSVQEARLCLPDNVTSDLVVISDRSMDKTREIAENIVQRSGIVICSDAGRVGAARGLAAKVALQRYRGRQEVCWLANTDADCEVPADWLLNHVAVATRGITAVAGIVDVDSFIEHDSGVEGLFQLTYLVNADRSHSHVHGANFGVRADAYLRVGGWRNLPNAEDHDLWDRLRQNGEPQFSDASLRVSTSGRRFGRAPLGFADALAAHNGTPA
jgi:glycosyltransferase involved in cell wall biosynthesis